MSFISINNSASASYYATTINGFWKTRPGAPVPTIAAVTAASPGLTGDARATITVTGWGKTYVSTFARLIYAVSALCVADSVYGEHRYTIDRIANGKFVMAFPTRFTTSV
jgi:hypothetical protein